MNMIASTFDSWSYSVRGLWSYSVDQGKKI
jgi:hypothetical protein